MLFNLDREDCFGAGSVIESRKCVADMLEYFSPQVAQYIKFEIPVLDSFVEKLKEEEEREINKLTKK